MASALAYRLTETADLPWPMMPRLSDLVDSIGLLDFGNQLLAFIDTLVGADHCAIYQMQHYEFMQVASVSAPGASSLPETCLGTYDIKRRLRQLGPTDVRVEICPISELHDVPFHPIARPQAMVLMGGRHDSLFCVRTVKTRKTEFSESELLRVREVADLLISFIGRHQDLILAKPNAFSALTSLDTIETRILNTKRLSRREAEVCARILYGCSSCEIASALGVGKESVMTYRKRAYQHLNIGSQRELLLWYLALGPNTSCN